MAASKPGTKEKNDPLRAAAVDYFAARSHNAWRQAFLKANPREKGRPRMRLRGGVMVDVNQPWAKLHPNAKADNARAAYDAFAAVRAFPKDREAAADFVHKCWIKRNRGDASQPKHLFKPYRRLSESEKDKDRAHVDQMKAALAAVRKRRKRAKTPAYRSVRVNAKSWARLETAAKALSARTGRAISAEALLNASIDMITLVCGEVEVKPRKR